MEYRIYKNQNGKYKIQEKDIFKTVVGPDKIRWKDHTSPHQFATRFDTIKEAKKYIDYLRKSNSWELIEIY